MLRENRNRITAGCCEQESRERQGLREREVVISSRAAAGPYSFSDTLSARAAPPLLEQEDSMTPLKRAGAG
jgi:hypothetical protein